MFNYEVENNEYDNLEECVNEVYELASKYDIDGVKNNIGGPFGAGIIYKKENGKYIILLIERNTVIASKDPTAHAEVNAIRSACKALNTRSLENCILVTTAKSCPMCLSAACWADIKTIYYSQSYDSAVSSGFRDEEIQEYIKGENDIIDEEQLKNPCCEYPFIEWNKKQDRQDY